MPDLPVIAITSGEPAGIGPDLLALLAPEDFNARLVIFGDRQLIRDRAQSLGCSLALQPYRAGEPPRSGTIEIQHMPLKAPAVAGKLEVHNAGYVLQLLDAACDGCLRGEFDAMVTGPIQKDIINASGLSFSGHTEYLAQRCDAASPVMMLATDDLRVALATTHLPLRDVADAINADDLIQIIRILDHDLQKKFAIDRPHIKVCGLNPHAGENGYLGHEEIEIIVPVIRKLQKEGIHVSGPYPADTVFTEYSLKDADAVLAMYHDQGLPVLKYAGFNHAINTTLGLPIIRTSVDHGTALQLAGSGKASPESLFAAIRSAIAQCSAVTA